MNDLGIISAKPRITVPEARKLLGSEFRHLSDGQVQDIILALTLLAKNNLHYIGSNNTHGSDSIKA
jgi:hypothetical protein